MALKNNYLGKRQKRGGSLQMEVVWEVKIYQISNTVVDFAI